MKPFPVGGAIFDLDGVLVDTACDHFEAWQRRARRAGGRASRHLRARIAPVTGPGRNRLVNVRVPARGSGWPPWLPVGERSG
jgi:beta-phosphoglucomutase-like phosphatase (HAD superfamily)